MKNVVDPKLYDFLKEYETGLYHKKGIIYAYVHIPFNALSDFVDIVGHGSFDDGGMEAVITNDTVCVELNDIIEGEGHYLSSYKNCFDKDDWKCHEETILLNEAD